MLATKLLIKRENRDGSTKRQSLSLKRMNRIYACSLNAFLKKTHMGNTCYSDYVDSHRSTLGPNTR